MVFEHDLHHIEFMTVPRQFHVAPLLSLTWKVEATVYVEKNVTWKAARPRPGILRRHYNKLPRPSGPVLTEDGQLENLRLRVLLTTLPCSRHAGTQSQIHRSSGNEIWLPLHHSDKLRVLHLSVFVWSAMSITYTLPAVLISDTLQFYPYPFSTIFDSHLYTIARTRPPLPSRIQ